MSEHVVAVYGSSASRPGDADWTLAVAVGSAFAHAGVGVTNGGYGGLMEAVSQGAAESGGRVVGVTAPPLFPDRTGGNRFLTETIAASTLTERIHIMDGLASAFVALPGSIGTLTELMIALNDAAIAPLRDAAPRPVVASRHPWERQLSGTAVPPGILEYGDTAEDLVEKTLARLGMG